MKRLRPFNRNSLLEYRIIITCLNHLKVTKSKLERKFILHSETVKI